MVRKALCAEELNGWPGIRQLGIGVVIANAKKTTLSLYDCPRQKEVPSMTQTRLLISIDYEKQKGVT